MAVFVASVSTYGTLEGTRSRFYHDARFPDVFVTVKRVRLAIVSRLNEIPGVTSVEVRIVRDVIVDWPSSALPVSARMVSLANSGQENLNRLHLRRGVVPDRVIACVALINEAFADANNIAPGADLRVILNGRVETFQIAGIALSPEYVYAVKPGLLILHDRHHAILWVDRSAAEAAFAMEGAFNDAVVSLAPGVIRQEVIKELDRILQAYTAWLERLLGVTRPRTAFCKMNSTS